LSGGRTADPEGAVLLVRGALADGDRPTAAALAEQTQRLAMITPGDPDMAAAADHARGLIEQDLAAFGWDSLTDAERRVADLVAQGLSNRQVGHRVLLSSHTVAFHLRHIFWKLGVTSRVQLARMAAEQGSLIGDGNIPSLGSSRLICASWRGRRT
jgi:DNA-binding CsgD family transcriptional regulator